MAEDKLKRARYSMVERRMWNDAWFQSLTPIPPCGQGLWVYLLTTPTLQVLPGLILDGEAGMAERLGWPIEGFREAFREVFAKGSVKVDWKARLVVLVNAISRNEPESPNVVRSWRAQWLEVPECELKVFYYRKLKAFTEGLGQGFAKAFAEAIEDPSPNQEQEQEQDQEQESRDPDPVRSPRSDRCLPAVRSDADPSDGAKTPSTKKSTQPKLALSDLTAAEQQVRGAITSDSDLAPIVPDPSATARDLARCAPGVDVPTEVAKAGAWLRANPTRKKKNGARFLLTWVERAQESNGGRGVRATTPKLEEDDDFPERPPGPPEIQKPWTALLDLVDQPTETAKP